MKEICNLNILRVCYPRSSHPESFLLACRGLAFSLDSKDATLTWWCRASRLHVQILYRNNPFFVTKRILKNSFANCVSLINEGSLKKFCCAGLVKWKRDCCRKWRCCSHMSTCPPEARPGPDGASFWTLLVPPAGPPTSATLCSTCDNKQPHYLLLSADDMEWFLQDRPWEWANCGAKTLRTGLAGTGPLKRTSFLAMTETTAWPPSSALLFSICPRWHEMNKFQPHIFDSHLLLFVYRWHKAEGHTLGTCALHSHH